MKKTLFICILISVLSCKKEEAEPSASQKTGTTNATDTTSTDTTTIPDTVIENNSNATPLFESNYDDSLYFESDTISQYGYLYYVGSFTIILTIDDPSKVVVGSYSNTYLETNVDYGLNLSHGVYLGDGSPANITLGSSNTQINYLNITKVQNDSVWIDYDVDWHYTHWLYTEKNNEGNIKCSLNGFKYR